jgi:predicted O-methyltransferase YrrM
MPSNFEKLQIGAFQINMIQQRRTKIANLNLDKTKTIHIRPYQLLRIEDSFPDEIKFFMPQAQGQGSTSTLESVLLIKLMRVVDASYIFEFGTYKGLTTRLLLENLPEKNIATERIFTLDLPDIENVNFQGSDMEIAKEALNFRRKYLGSKNRHQVKQIFQDCLTFDAAAYLKKFQLIFVDGNHALEYVKSDTENAFRMLGDAPSCIAWHDYGNPEFPELTAYINELAESKTIYHIENTMLAFHLIGKEVAPRDPQRC